MTHGDCSQLPGLQLLLDWRAGKTVIQHSDLVPPGNWGLYSQSGMPVTFLYPADWTPYALWASGLTPAGAIDWQTASSPSSYLVGARIVSPRGDALYEYVSGTLVGVALSLNQAAAAAEQGVLGDRQTTEEICVYQDSTSLTPAWTRAGWFGDLAVTTGGQVLSDANAFNPYTTMTYQSFVGPENQFTDLMRSVYIPIMFQFMMSGSSTTSPTPTPTPDLRTAVSAYATVRSLVASGTFVGKRI